MNKKRVFPPNLDDSYNTNMETAVIMRSFIERPLPVKRVKISHSTSVLVKKSLKILR